MQPSDVNRSCLPLLLLLPLLPLLLLGHDLLPVEVELDHVVAALAAPADEHEAPVAVRASEEAFVAVVAVVAVVLADEGLQAPVEVEAHLAVDGGHVREGHFVAARGQGEAREEYEIHKRHFSTF